MNVEEIMMQMSNLTFRNKAYDFRILFCQLKVPLYESGKIRLRRFGTKANRLAKLMFVTLVSCPIEYV